MLRTALNIHWNQLLTNEQLYGSLPKISEKIRRRRLKLAGHCRRSDGEIAANLVLWTPKHGQRKQGRPALTYIDLLKKDTDIPAEELSNCMRDRTVWRSVTAQADRWPLAIRRRRSVTNIYVILSCYSESLAWWLYCQCMDKLTLKSILDSANF